MDRINLSITCEKLDFSASEYEHHIESGRTYAILLDIYLLLNQPHIHAKHFSRNILKSTRQGRSSTSAIEQAMSSGRNDREPTIKDVLGVVLLLDLLQPGIVRRKGKLRPIHIARSVANLSRGSLRIYGMIVLAAMNCERTIATTDHSSYTQTPRSSTSPSGQRSGFPPYYVRQHAPQRCGPCLHPKRR